jgi:tRNA A-37 threonylcarbamoyl transferase component Bud32
MLTIDKTGEGRVEICRNKYSSNRFVFAVKYPSDDRIEAIGRRAMNERFASEAAMLCVVSKLLKVYGVVQLHHLFYDTERGIFGIAMAAVPSHLPLGKFLDLPHSHCEQLRVFHSITRTFSELHFFHICHGDLTLDNMLVTVEGHRSVLIDFGASYTSVDRKCKSSLASDLCFWRTLMGRRLFQSRHRPPCIAQIQKLDISTPAAALKILNACQCVDHVQFRKEPIGECGMCKAVQSGWKIKTIAALTVAPQATLARMVSKSNSSSSSTSNASLSDMWGSVPGAYDDGSESELADADDAESSVNSNKDAESRSGDDHKSDSELSDLDELHINKQSPLSDEGEDEEDDDDWDENDDEDP